MFEVAIEILNIIEKHNFKAYIVGGFVRDYLLKNKSSDIDICTSATPDDLKIIFNDLIIFDSFGATKLKYKGYNFDLTTFRRDFYIFNKLYIKYEKEIKNDVLRRDFTINSLYMDKNKNIIDLINGKEDINSKLIRMIGNSNKRIKEDPIRILRAIKYAGKLGFSIDKNLINSINKYKKLLKNISYDKKKKELIKILENKNSFKLLRDFEIEDINLNNVMWTNNIYLTLAQANFFDKYSFSNKELKEIEVFKTLLKCDEISNYEIYIYGLEKCLLISKIKNINEKEIKNIYNNLQIYSQNDIVLSHIDICNLLNIKPSIKSKNIYKNIEKNIVCGIIRNKKNDIINYIKGEYYE